MIDQNRHRFLMVQILKDIYSDLDLSSDLGFKGGTALMFFYGLPRFSVDLDFNLLKPENEELVYTKLRKIILKYGTIFDEARKYYGPIVVLDYGKNERKLKVEVSNRQFENSYETKNLLGISMKVMLEKDMFAHKLCALLDRKPMANRDIFDSWFFMQKQTRVNIPLVENRMNMSWPDYMQAILDALEKKDPRGLLDGLGQLMDQKTKTFVKNELLPEMIRLLNFYKEYPIV
ncbi:MAG: nucleotidyl transferase AbiEii/AbiGii toxin family protein [Bacteroidales bacterium]